MVRYFFQFAVVLWTCFGRAFAGDITSPLSPPASLEHLRVEPGLSVELVACEPAVVDPIAIRFDEDGRLWVVEMRDYPHGPPPGQAPLSMIKQLTDADGDGLYETSRVFAEGLLFPTGLQPWKGGLIVTLAGQVAYLRDADGDGRADAPETWFTGFTAENPQLRANHPRFSLDNRVYIANGLRGGTIIDPRRRDAAPLSISGLDFCFDPSGGNCEAVSGNGQFGLTFDDFGHRFVCNNRAPLDHVVLENRYLARNPLLAVPTTLATVARMGEQSRVYPLAAAWTTSNLHAGQFTAACGVEIYRGDVLGDEYRGNAFVCEPTGSLVHREVLEPDGVTFKSRPAREGSEFLASPDPWFRPVNLEIGPDGGLYVVDMYRAVIEHPQFMPSELQNRPDLRLGDDRGRIYHVVRKGHKPSGRAPRLSAATSAELTALMCHPNAWWRETAGRLLYERQDRSIVPRLEKLAAEAAQPSSRASALWTLAGLQSLSAETITTALADAHPAVREHGVALAESRLAELPDLRDRIVKLAGDDDPRVRFRVALCLGGLSSDVVIAPLIAIALARPDDPWTRRAVATALPADVAPLLLATLRAPQLRGVTAGAAELMLVRELATIVGSRRDDREIDKLLGAVTESAVPDTAAARENALLGLAQGLSRRGQSLAGAVARNARQATIEPMLNALFERAAAAMLDENLSESARAEKIDLVRYAPSARFDRDLMQLATHNPSQPLRLRAIAALGTRDDPAIAKTLLSAMASQTPAVRRATIDVLSSRQSGALLLLDAVESGQVARAEIDAARENVLIKSPDDAVRARAKAILPQPLPAERKRLLAEYQSSLTLKANAAAGKELFRKHCATCHHIGDVGVDVGPDISDSRVKTPAQLLTDILNPNQAIDNNYVSYTIAAADGTLHTGVIAAETATSVTLRQPENKTLSLLRTDIETIRSNGMSLMPEGFEKHLSEQQMADLISFIKNWRYPMGAAPGEKP